MGHVEGKGTTCNDSQKNEPGYIREWCLFGIFLEDGIGVEQPEKVAPAPKVHSLS